MVGGGSSAEYKKQEMTEDNSNFMESSLNTDMNSSRSKQGPSASN